MVRDGDRVLCHLCGRWFKSVVAHLRSHGWHHLDYRAAFGLLPSEPLEGTGTRSLRATAMTERRKHDPAIRAGCELGRELVRTGALTQAAAAPTSTCGTPPRPRPNASATRHRHARPRPDGGGASLAAISREAGLHKDWLCRHLAVVAPGSSVNHRHGIARQPHATSRATRDERADQVAARFGFARIDEYFADRRAGGMSWRAIAAECGRPATWVRRRADLT